MQMMKRYFIFLCYDGTDYHGWQIQPNGNTVQEELQRGLSTILREETTVTGAGRTDTGGARKGDGGTFRFLQEHRLSPIDL